MFFDGPTGAGKSLIADMVAQRMQVHAIMNTADKALQDQYVRDFHETGARTIKGKANYRPQIPEIEDMLGQRMVQVTCDDCDITPAGCTFCPDPDMCSYRVAREEAKDSRLAVLNYAYFMNETQTRQSRFRGRGLVVCDEADVLEGIVLGQVEVVFSERDRNEYGLGQPDKLDDDTGEAWAVWLRDVVVPAYVGAIEKHKQSSKKGLEYRRKLKRLTNKRNQAEMVLASLEDTEEGEPPNWVLTGYETGRGRGAKGGPLVFKPIHASEHGERMLWKNGQKFLLMSGTLVSPDELAETLGWEGSFGVVTAPMPFEVDRRKIYYVPLGKMTRRDQEQTLPRMTEGINRILEQWDGHRAIIHTVSYDLTKTLRSSIMKTGRQVFTYSGANEKEETIKAFELSDNGVLIGPSIGRGTDFKGDRARVNIVAKMPFPYLGDKQVKARRYAKGGARWYITKAIRELVQACGRTTRSESDWGVTYVLDSSFGGVLRKERNLFPGWFREALDTSIKPSQLLGGSHLPRPLLVEETQAHDR